MYKWLVTYVCRYGKKRYNLIKYSWHHHRKLVVCLKHFAYILCKILNSKVMIIKLCDQLMNSYTGHHCDIIVTNSTNEPDSPTQLDVMRQMVKNKEMMTDINFDKRCSIESEMSEASTLISVSSENLGEEEYRRRKRINHHSIRGTLSDSEMEMSGVGVSHVVIMHQNVSVSA